MSGACGLYQEPVTPLILSIERRFITFTLGLLEHKICQFLCASIPHVVSRSYAMRSITRAWQCVQNVAFPSQILTLAARCN